MLAAVVRISLNGLLETESVDGLFNELVEKDVPFSAMSSSLLLLLLETVN